jgi:dihydroxyacetone kinase
LKIPLDFESITITMRTKHFVNDADKLVEAALRSHCILRPDLSLDIESKILYAPTHANKPSSVSIISGGGSGHEPSFTGFVGEGVLSASVAGTIFASPSSRQVLKAIEGVDGSKGILVTVMNYTGDVLNFGVALEKAKARNPDLKIEMLVIGDDVGVPRSRAGKVGRRGIAGTVLVHKITGALAAAGSSLDEVARVGRLVGSNLASIGVSISRVHVPGRPHEEIAQDSLGLDEVELGMGIHNESGCGRRSGDDAELPVLIRDMLRQLLDPNDADRNFLSRKPREVVLLVNNLGALSVLELGAVVTEVTEQLQRDYQLKAARVFSGTFMTSLDGPGFSVSLLNVVDTGVQQNLLDLLDAQSNISGWHVARTSTTPASNLAGTGGSLPTRQTEESQRTHLKCDMETTLKHLKNGLSAIIAAEPEITKYDDIVGDGDCGTTLKRGAEGKI